MLEVLEVVAAGEKAVTLVAKMPAEKISAVLSFILLNGLRCYDWFSI